LAVLLVIDSQTNYQPDKVREEITRRAYLLTAFDHVVLVDAYCVDPNR
jgi:hypothetical protein